MKQRILFVCLGNICRSPAADAIMNKLVMEAGVNQRIVVDSAGTYGGHAGELPDPRMRAAGLRRGFQIDHISRRFTSADFDDFDMIVVMDDSNYERVSRLAPDPEGLSKIYRMADFCRRHDITHVPDPYYEGLDGFEYVLDILEDGCRELLQNIMVKKECRE